MKLNFSCSSRWNFDYALFLLLFYVIITYPKINGYRIFLGYDFISGIQKDWNNRLIYHIHLLNVCKGRVVIRANSDFEYVAFYMT